MVLRALSFQVLIKISVYSPALLTASHIEATVDPLDKTVSKKPPADQVPGPEAERGLEVIKSALRVAMALTRCDEASSSRRWVEFYERLRTRENIVFLLNQLSLERSGDN